MQAQRLRKEAAAAMAADRPRNHRNLKARQWVDHTDGHTTTLGGGMNDVGNRHAPPADRGAISSLIAQNPHAAGKAFVVVNGGDGDDAKFTLS